ncbi:MAG TPA: ParB/RepB/Spo0J family partition protein [Pirellulales bacterium]|nr:ParB/RepB/Spo0J family partition protein [Pirellulales bacterium]
MTKERRLGRGLEALLGRTFAEPQQSQQLTLHVPSDASGGEPAANASTGGSFLVSVQVIDRNPFQPRREFDEAEITELAASLREHGLIQPLVVRRAGDRYQLIAGERRLRAAMQVGWTEVPVQVREADDRQVAEIAIVENLQRKDLNPLEKAASFEQYLARYHCTQEELAGRLQIDRSTIANLIRLLELPAAVQDAIRSGTISQGHARALLPLGDEQEQIAFCDRIKSDGLSVRATEQMVQDQIREADSGIETGSLEIAGRVTRSPSNRNQHLGALEQELRQSLGAKVSIRETAKGRGRIVVHFADREDFDRIREIMCPTGSTGLARAG